MLLTRGVWARYAGLGLLIAAVFVFFRQREESEAARRKAELDRERLGQQMDEARLQVLQAQIEPHFLFNTLANVRRLYQTDAAAAESMLDNLMRYLAVALPQMRAADSTLGREAALAESYLVIQRIRMGRRLAFEIDVPQSLREAAVPPMMLLTLVENAIKHGISPLPEGGSVRVSARVADRQLRLQVADSGQGFTKTSGGGTGLANTRARLAAMYGAAAHLRIELNSPRGVIATISLPYAASAPTMFRRDVTSTFPARQRMHLAHGARGVARYYPHRNRHFVSVRVCYVLYETVAYMPVVLSATFRYKFATRHPVHVWSARFARSR